MLQPLSCVSGTPAAPQSCLGQLLCPSVPLSTPLLVFVMTDQAPKTSLTKPG